MTIDEVDDEFATEFAERFADTWRSPDLAKHEALWSDDIVLTQPMMGTLRGKPACRQSFARLFALVPDLHADVHRVGHGSHDVFIEFTLSGTYGGKPIAWDAVDRFTFTGGLIAERFASQQEGEGSVNRHQPPTPPDSAGLARTGSHHPVASAEQAAPGPPPNSPRQQRGRRGTSRKQPAPKLIGAA